MISDCLRPGRANAFCPSNAEQFGEERRRCCGDSSLSRGAITTAMPITADDANHTRQRKMISHSFADKTLRDLEPMLKYWVGKMKDKLGEKATAGEQVDMLKYYNCTTFGECLQTAALRSVLTE